MSQRVRGAGRYRAESTYSRSDPPLTASSLNCIVVPEGQENRYFHDDRLDRSDLTSGRMWTRVVGGRLAVNFAVYAVAATGCTPVADAIVEVWHSAAVQPCANGVVGATIGQSLLRGYQRTDEHGMASFSTIFPWRYAGATPHLHFRIRALSPTGAMHTFTSRFILDDDASYARTFRVGLTFGDA